MKMRKFAEKACAVILAAMCIVGLFSVVPSKADASGVSLSVDGAAYEFEEDTHYTYSEQSSISANTDPLGRIYLTGDIEENGDMNGVPAYSVNSGSVDLSYIYRVNILQVVDTEWHLSNDSSKKVDTVTLSKGVRSGAVLVQTSLDGNHWTVVYEQSDIFASKTELSDPFYTTKDIQLENGCYYRVIIAYPMERDVKTGSIFGKNVYGTEEKEICEEYKFYIKNGYDSGYALSSDVEPRQEFGSKTRFKTDTGYSQVQTIDLDDPHYGWNLGEFVINGYTDTRKDSDGTTIFLKNVGDVVTLWFDLEQDITCLNHNEDLSIADDKDGYDKDFEISKTDFGHGALIVQYTDASGKVHDPVLYTDFLSSDAAAGANTRVQVFEEGDYVVKLDYKIKDDSQAIGYSTSDYCITFKFQVRNSACAIFPFDVVTGSELTGNIAYTENGFYLDTARSQYLKVTTTRSTLSVDDNGMIVKDDAIIRAATDGSEYVTEGIYTFNVHNNYTDTDLTKVIFVGTDKNLLALYNAMKTSENMDTAIAELNTAIASGATIESDGTLTVPATPTPKPTPYVYAEAHSTAAAGGSTGTGKPVSG